MNSSDLLGVIRTLSATDEGHVSLDVQDLASRAGMTVPKLIAVLTELEQRDEIVMELKTSEAPFSKELQYEGSVRLMECPPDVANRSQATQDG